jgi:hypothetical protein
MQDAGHLLGGCSGSRSCLWLSLFIEGDRDPPEYSRNMRHDRDTLNRLADNRRRRLRANGRPAFGLTVHEVERSTRTAMRLADASKSQAEARSAHGRFPLSA